MKSLITAVALLLSTPTFAMKLSCVTEFPTTSVYGVEEGDEFVVQIYHHNGTGYMPLHMGVITPNDLPVLAERAEDFHRLGDYYEFRYPLEKCQRVSDVIMSCTHGKDAVVNGVKVRPWSIHTIKLTGEMASASWNEVQVSFLMDIDGKSRNLSYKYADFECYQEKKAEKIFSVIGNK